MKILALALLLVTANDTTLVETAKAAKASRRKSTGKIITNADVKKSKGKLGQTTANAPVDAQAEESLVEKQASMRKARTEYNASSAAARAEVERLEKEVASLEQQYYEENDLDHRDGELVRRFNEAKKKLDAARETLAAIQPVP
jgi:DNA repair ATPase RecN